MSKSDRDNRANQLNPNNRAYQSSRSSRSSASTPSDTHSESAKGSWRSRMDARSASRIQSHADRTGENDDFKSRAQRAAERNDGSEKDT